jgi:hypothetical protein
MLSPIGQVLCGLGRRGRAGRGLPRPRPPIMGADADGRDRSSDLAEQLLQPAGYLSVPNAPESRSWMT